MLPLVWTLLTPALHRSATIASAGVVVRGKPASSKKSLAATPLRSTPYTLCPHDASHSMSTALPHSGTNTRLESSGGDVTPSPRSEFLCFMSARCVAGRWKPMRPSRQRSCQSFTAAACASASTSGGVPSSTTWEALRDWGGGVASAASTAVFFTAGPVATDPDRDAKTRANPRVSKVPLAREMPAATPAAAPTATEAMTAELGQRVAPRWESLADESPSLFPALAGRACFDRPRRVAPASPIGRQWGEPPPPSAAQRMPVAHDRRGRTRWISPGTLRAAAASRRSERAPAARVFHLPRRERGRGAEPPRVESVLSRCRCRGART